MDCKMCDLKTSIRHLLHDGSYCEQCECGWVSDRYINNDGIKEFIGDDEEHLGFVIDDSEYINNDIN
jgi:hypothetical protein